MTSLWVRMAVLFPAALEENLKKAHASGLVREKPTLFQLLMGIARMQWRVATRPDSVGTCARHPVRATWRARWLSPRPMRFPFLVLERAIAPLDFSGLASSRERVIRHLLGAHHDGAQFVYDLELLSIHEGALEELHERAKAVVEGRDPRAEWLRDLCVFENYHEELLETLKAYLRGDLLLAPDVAADPDITLRAYLAWCAAAPRDLAEAWAALRSGALHFGAYQHAQVAS